MTKRWKNWYRVPRTGLAIKPTITCTVCGKGDTLEFGETFCNHCTSWPTKAEAQDYAPRIYAFCEFLGSYPEGERPNG